MSYYVKFFKEYDFKEANGYYKLVTKGGDSISWTSPVCVKIGEAFEEIGMLDIYSSILPTFYDIELLEEEDIAKTKEEIISPLECLRIIEENNCLSLIHPDIKKYLEFLISKWKDQYYVILID